MEKKESKTKGYSPKYYGENVDGRLGCAFFTTRNVKRTLFDVHVSER